MASATLAVRYDEAARFIRGWLAPRRTHRTNWCPVFGRFGWVEAFEEKQDVTEIDTSKEGGGGKKVTCSKNTSSVLFFCFCFILPQRILFTDWDEFKSSSSYCGILSFSPRLQTFATQTLAQDFVCWKMSVCLSTHTHVFSILNSVLNLSLPPPASLNPTVCLLLLQSLSLWLTAKPRASTRSSLGSPLKQLADLDFLISNNNNNNKKAPVPEPCRVCGLGLGGGRVLERAGWKTNAHRADWRK